MATVSPGVREIAAKHAGEIAERLATALIGVIEKARDPAVSVEAAKPLLTAVVQKHMAEFLTMFDVQPSMDTALELAASQFDGVEQITGREAADMIRKLKRGTLS